MWRIWPVMSLVWPLMSLIWPLMSLISPLISLIWPMISRISPILNGHISDIPCHEFGQGAFRDMIRMKCTEIGKTQSKLDYIKCGVPQRSKIGPLLFLPYINHIVLSSAVFKFYLFADNANLFFSSKNHLFVTSIIVKYYLFNTKKSTVNMFYMKSS